MLITATPAALAMPTAALPRAATLHRAVLRMQAAHAHRRSRPRRRDRQFVTDLHGARVHGAGDHRANAVERECAVDGQAEGVRRIGGVA